MHAQHTALKRQTALGLSHWELVSLSTTQNSNQQSHCDSAIKNTLYKEGLDTVPRTSYRMPQCDEISTIYAPFTFVILLSEWDPSLKVLEISARTSLS